MIKNLNFIEQIKHERAKLTCLLQQIWIKNIEKRNHWKMKLLKNVTKFIDPGDIT